MKCLPIDLINYNIFVIFCTQTNDIMFPQETNNQYEQQNRPKQTISYSH